MKAIREIYPDSIVEAKTWEPRWSETGDHRYLVLNYEQFQQPDSESRLANFIARERVDFIVIDEIHFAKQRQHEHMSRRKRLVMGLVSGAAEANPSQQGDEGGGISIGVIAGAAVGGLLVIALVSFLIYRCRSGSGSGDAHYVEMT